MSQSQNGKTYIRVDPTKIRGITEVERVEVTPRTTCVDVLDHLSDKLGFRSTLYLLVELDGKKETVLSYQDRPFERQMKWREKSGGKMFALRLADLRDVVLQSSNAQHETLADRKVVEMVKKGLLPNMRLGDPDLDDLAGMQSPHQKKVLDMLKGRFGKDKIYTYSGEVLISINPYKQLKIYNPRFAKRYQRADK